MNLKECLIQDQAKRGSIAQTIKKTIDARELLFDAVGIFSRPKGRQWYRSGRSGSTSSWR